MFNSKHTELTLLYENRCYNWSELNKPIAAHSEKQSSSDLIHNAQNRFHMTLSVLQGFSQNKTIFPITQNYSETEQNKFLKPIDTLLHKDVQSDECIALVIATSGSQALPKLALISRKNILSHCASFSQVITMDRQSIWLNCLPMNHIAGIMIIYRCWYHQATMLLHDNFDVEKIWQDIHKYSVTHISLVPIMLARLLEYCQDASPPKSLQFVLIGGDKLSEILYQRAINSGWPIWISYGMTETTSTLALGQHPDQLFILPGFDVSQGDQGTLKVRGDMVISSYAKTEPKSFSNGWFETSDRVLLENNKIKMLGRNDHMIISGGKNIAPEWIEQKLLLAPDIDDVAIGKYRSQSSDNNWGDSIAALICGDIEAFELWLQEHVEASYRPRYLLKTDTVPRNSMGKIDRKAVDRLLNSEKENL